MLKIDLKYWIPLEKKILVCYSNKERGREEANTLYGH